VVAIAAVMEGYQGLQDGDLYTAGIPPLMRSVIEEMRRTPRGGQENALFNLISIDFDPPYRQPLLAAVRAVRLRFRQDGPAT
jgi:hypothetical protein